MYYIYMYIYRMILSSISLMQYDKESLNVHRVLSTLTKDGLNHHENFLHLLIKDNQE